MKILLVRGAGTPSTLGGDGRAAVPSHGTKAGTARAGLSFGWRRLALLLCTASLLGPVANGNPVNEPCLASQNNSAASPWTPVASESNRTPTSQTSLDQLLREASQGGDFQAISSDAIQQAETLFERCFRARKGDFTQLAHEWSQLEMQLTPDERTGLWFVREDPKHKMGRGFYVFRIADSLPLAFEAPHSFFDRYTREITLSLFVQSQATAAAWNTIHRSKHDMAHVQDCYLNAFTRAFAKVWPSGVIAQLHGFQQQKRSSETGRLADMILSTGSSIPDYRLTQLTGLLRESMEPFEIYAYPLDIQELGGTTNAQAAQLTTLGHSGFLHIELSQPLRLKLRDDPDAQAEFLKNLRKVYRINGL